MIALANGIIYTISSIIDFLALTWWLYLFFILLPVSRSAWIFWRQEVFKAETKWTLLELRMPRETTRSPKAMEQVFAAWHSLHNAAGDIKEKYWDGEITRWFALEMVSFSGEIHFYLRIYNKQKNLYEAPLFAYYPDVEITEVEDYVDKLPATTKELYEQRKDMYGIEMKLAKSPAYPIKSYAEFEKDAEEEKKFDPIAAFLEILGKLKPGEIVGIQYLCAPLANTWRIPYEAVADELKVTKKKKQGASKKAKSVWEFQGGILPVLSVKTGEEKTETSSLGDFMMRSPGDTDTLKAIEENLSKPAFSTLIRFFYISPKEMYYDSFPRRGIIGAFNQYSSLSLNSFAKNQASETRTRVWNWPHIFPKTRGAFKKQRLLYNYRNRYIPPETGAGKFFTSHFFNFNTASKMFPLNVEGLATLFHPPTSPVVTTPHIRRVDSRKAGPPAGVAIYGGGEQDLERFL